MRPRLIVLALIVLASLVWALPAQARTAHTTARDETTRFFGGHVPQPGTSIHNVVVVPGEPGMAPKLLAKTITVTADVNGVLTATAALENSGGGTMNATLTWENQCHWKFDIELNSSPESASTNATAVNLDQLKGTVANVGCEHHVNLELIGYKLGSATLDIAMHAEHGGFTGTTTLKEDMVLGGTTYLAGSTVTVSTLSPEVSVEGHMRTSIGTFTVKAGVTAPSGSYTVHLAVTGADLVYKTASFEVTKFHFSTSATFPTGGTATYHVASASAGGEVVMKKTTYELIDISLTMTGSTVTHFSFGIKVTHIKSSTKSYAFVLKMALDGDGGTFDEYSSAGALSKKTFHTALLGSIDISQTRRFERSGMERHVKIGMLFGVSVYTTSATSGYHSYIGAGGYFDADRVSGGFGCLFGTESMDFSCEGRIRINPRFAGIWRYTWYV